MARYVAKWNVDGILKISREALSTGLARASQHLASRIKQEISRPGVLKTRKFGTSFVAGKRVPRGTEGADIVRISRPGEPPRKRTGMLRSSIRAEKVLDSGEYIAYKIGSDVAYAASLELGNRRGLKPRPYLRSTLATELDTLRQILIDTARKTYKRPERIKLPASSELTKEDIERGRRNVHYAEPPAMGEM